MERIRRFIRELSERQWLEQQKLEGWDIQAGVYTVPGQYDGMRPYTEGGDFTLFPSVQGTTYFFRRTLAVPAEWAGQRAGLIFESGGEGLLRVNGESRQGLDRNHTFAALEPSPDGRPLELEIELFDPIPEPVDPLNQQAVIQPPVRAIRTMLVLVNEAVQSLMYSAVIVRDAAVLLPEADMRRTRMLEALYRVIDGFLNMDETAVREGSAVAALEKKLRADIAGIGGNAEGTIHMVGQSHIDIAWLWPARETVRKTSRTFSTVNALMEEYPEYQFAQSQPQLFQYLKDNDPVLYAKVKERIREGRWELVGGMWVEPDLNIPSGESLMRQMLYGQRFYLEEFGKTSDIEWLPDTFGYCASLPQILRHGGVRYFMTTKLGWNDTNVFPYDLFHWVGIDGTSMLSYLNHGVNENTLPKDVHDHWQSFREKNIHNEQMLLYGHGDGGGGVTREMLEYIRRAELMVGQPASTFSNAAGFFSGIGERQPQVDGQHLRVRFVGLALIPVSYRRIVIRLGVSMAVLNTEAQGLPENNGVDDMETVLCHFAGIIIEQNRIALSPGIPVAADRSIQGYPVIRAVIFAGRVAPGRAEIILRPCAVQAGRPRFTVDEEHVIPFSRPAEARHRIQMIDAEIAADIMPFTHGIHKHIVAVTRQIFNLIYFLVGIIGLVLPVMLQLQGCQVDRPLCRILPAPGSMEVEAVLRNLLLHIINIEIEDHFIFALINNLDPRAAAERHFKKTVHRRLVLNHPLGRYHIQRHGDIVAGYPVADPEEIANRRFHTGLLLPIPEHADQHFAERIFIFGCDCHPDMLDDARAFNFSNGCRLAGSDNDEIPVASRLIPTGLSAGQPFLAQI